MLLEEMVLLEMNSLKIEGVGLKEGDLLVKKEKKKGRAKTWEKLLKRYKKTEKEAITRLAQSIQVENFIQNKVDTLKPIITAPWG
jgi:hypothetical protein